MTAKKNPLLTKSEALELAWKSRADYKGYDRSKGSLFNSWRAKVYTKRGIVVPNKWRTFRGFCEDVQEGWFRGAVLCRIDPNLPYSADNFIWREKGGETICKLAKLEYNGETKTLIEWCADFGLNYNGVRQRYFKGRNYTSEQILFGKYLQSRGEVMDIDELSDEQKQKDKISKMLSAYRYRDVRRGRHFDIDKNWFYEQITKGSCYYCGDTKRLGLDRIDNSKGHTMDNVVVCCYECNVARGGNFSWEEMKIIGEAIKKVKENRNEDNPSKT